MRPPFAQVARVLAMWHVVIGEELLTLQQLTTELTWAQPAFVPTEAGEWVGLQVRLPSR